MAAVSNTEHSSPGLPGGHTQLGPVVTRPERDVPVVAVAGELDVTRVDQLTDVLWPRLIAAVQAVVLDLSAVSFLSVAALDLLNQARLQAQARDLSLRLVVAGRDVHRALTVAGLAQNLPCCATVDEALRSRGLGSAMLGPNA